MPQRDPLDMTEVQLSVIPYIGTEHFTECHD